MDQFYWRLVGGLAWRIFVKRDIFKIPLVGMDLMNFDQIIHIPRLLKHPTEICVCPTVVQSVGYLWILAAATSTIQTSTLKLETRAPYHSLPLMIPSSYLKMKARLSPSLRPWTIGNQRKRTKLNCASCCNLLGYVYDDGPLSTDNIGQFGMGSNQVVPRYRLKMKALKQEQLNGIFIISCVNAWDLPDSFSCWQFFW